MPINYIGHAEKWGNVEIEGSITARDCLVRYRRNVQVMAVASIFRDLENLEEEVSMRGELPGANAEMTGCSRK